MTPPRTEESLLAENAELRERLEIAEETLRAIRNGEVDALIVESSSGPQVFILQTTDADSNRFRSDILGKVSDAVIAVDENYHVIYLNAAAERQYDVTASQALGAPLAEIHKVRWANAEEAAAARRALEETGQWLGRSIHVKRDGSTLDVESSVSRLLAADGTPAGQLAVIRDITERSAAEEALRENQARLRWTLESASIGDWELDLATGTSRRSLLHDQIFGYREGGADWQVECRITWPNGTIRWVHIHGRVFRESPERPGRMRGVIFDITERKQAEAAIRENEVLFATIIDEAPGGVYVVSDRFRMMRVNPLAKPTFSAAEPVIGRDFAEVMRILWGAEVGGRLIDIFWHTLETGEPYAANRFTAIRDDLREEKSYDWQTRRITLPNGHFGVVCYFSDVTEQWKLEEALRASEQRASDIVQSISDGFITFDLNWRITYLSNRGAEILAPILKTAENVRGKVFWEEFPPTMGTPIEDTFRRAMRDQVATQVEILYEPLGRWFDIRAYPSPTGLSVYFLDISERKETEKELAGQAAALVMADRSKDEFLAMLAHELRNPLAPLRNATEILRASAASPGQREMAQQMMARQIENMSRMIDDLLDVSRINEGKIELHLKPLMLQTVLQGVAAVARPHCARNGQELVVTLPDKPVFVNGDATRLEQLFGNLLTNACKYSGSGSRISLIAQLEPEDRVRIHVRDNGIGMNEDLLPRIFDLFVQSSRSLDRSHGGLGIGLTVASRLVKMHGGSIEAKSDGPGTGAEFIVLLPTHATEVLPNAEPAPVESNRSLRILIVDDNKDAAETMGLLQQLNGHVTRIAHAGPEALALATGFLPDVILLDIGLPGMDGYEVARRIRSIPATKDAFLIALTGYGRDEDKNLAKAAGFDEHLAKPADLNLLKEWFQSRVAS